MRQKLTLQAFLMACLSSAGMLVCTPAFSQYIGQDANALQIQPQIAVKAQSFNLQDVKLLDSRFKQNMERDAKWMLSISNARLLHTWRLNAGIASTAKPLGGWEAPGGELRGHIMGHILSGLALMYASTGEIVYKQKADSLVAGLAECQQVLDEDGYLSAFPKQFINRAIKGEEVWAPWYTIHKVMAGLTDMYLYTGNRQALEVVEKMSDWAFHKLEPLSAQQLATMEKTEFGGMNEVAYNLYAITGNVNDRKLAELFYHHAILDPLANKEDKLAGVHANTQIPKIIGEARGYELTGEEQLRIIAAFFWQTVIDHHTYATGGNSDSEYFFAPDQISKHLTASTTETCNTYNMLKLTRHLFTWTADVKYADYYERALYNHILSSQEEGTGMVTYLQPTKPGLFKTYSSKENSFWCCVGTGFENHAKYAESIYYHNNDGIYINLFIPSELNWKQKGFKLVQQTLYPEENTTHLTVKEAPAGPLSLYVRYPYWATSGAAVTVNEKVIKITQKPGSYIELKRNWKTGDKVTVTYPMSLRLVATNDNPKEAAIAYGPLVLAGDMGVEGIKAPAPFAKDQLDYKDYMIPKDITNSLNVNGRRLDDCIIPVAGRPLIFGTNGIAPRPIILMPYYQIDKQRYVIYWNLN
ncbi:MAG: glycoside hydrolase family protein [Mucilaginibacter sp.]|nr:glycoside hydrolase family protein [Mucilaginibacter sp.]